MKKVVLAIDSLKGCLTSAEAEAAAEAGVREHYPQAEVVKVPVSDGGDGMLGVFSQSQDCRLIETGCHNALMRPVRAAYAVTPDGMAVLESAAACGIGLLKPGELNPLRATTYGVGELLADALRRGYRRYIVGLGGSATSDCGLGMLAALKDNFGEAWRERLPDGLEITLASDVGNPLYGPRGAAAVFGPQKGATPEMVDCLDRRARTFSRMASRHMGTDHSHDHGAGAAGGLGYAFIQFLGAKVESGADLILRQAGFGTLAADADLIVTGEGSADAQTLMGKIPVRVLEYGRRKGIPVVLIAGRVSGSDALLAAGFARVCCINPPGLPLADALRPAVARENIRRALANI
ncbi:glycerate kinase [Prevotella dentasini]